MNVIGHLRRLTALALMGLLGAMPMAAQDQAPATIRKLPIPSR